jgi:L-asparagine transporter-like permease
MTSFGSVGDQLRSFGETTSVRGIPRAMKSNDHRVAVLWVGAVILCSCMMLWQVSAVLTRYYSYEIVTVFSEANVNAVSKPLLFYIFSHLG